MAGRVALAIGVLILAGLGALVYMTETTERPTTRIEQTIPDETFPR